MTHRHIHISMYNYMLMGVFWDRLKFGSTAALDCSTGQNKGRYCKKELLLLLVSMSESTTQSKNGLNQGQRCPCLNFLALSSTLLAKILYICLVELFMIQILKYLYDLDVKVGRKGTLAVCSASSAILSYISKVIKICT